MTLAQKRLTLAAAILGSIAAFIDSTVVNVALPHIREDLGGGLAGQQWLTDAYLLTLGSLLLAGGSLGDLYGRRRIFSLGLPGFGVASVRCAAAPSIAALILARGPQGPGAALPGPNTLRPLVAPPEPGRAAPGVGWQRTRCCRASSSRRATSRPATPRRSPSMAGWAPSRSSSCSSSSRSRATARSRPAWRCCRSA